MSLCYTSFTERLPQYAVLCFLSSLRFSRKIDALSVAIYECLSWPRTRMFQSWRILLLMKWDWAAALDRLLVL